MLSLKEKNQEGIEMKVSKGVYIALCLFLGGLGIHKFYSGKWVQGLLYLAFCITGVSMILSVFDLFGAMFKKSDEHGRIRV